MRRGNVTRESRYQAGERRAAAARANSSGVLTLRVERPEGSMAANSEDESSRTLTSEKKAMMRRRPDSSARRAAAAQAGR